MTLSHTEPERCVSVVQYQGGLWQKGRQHARKPFEAMMPADITSRHARKKAGGVMLMVIVLTHLDFCNGYPLLWVCHKDPADQVLALAAYLLRTRPLVLRCKTHAPFHCGNLSLSTNHHDYRLR